MLCTSSTVIWMTRSPGSSKWRDVTWQGIIMGMVVSFFFFFCLFFIREKKLLTSSEDYGKDLTGVQNLRKKHQRLEAELNNHEARIQVGGWLSKLVISHCKSVISNICIIVMRFSILISLTFSILNPVKLSNILYLHPPPLPRKGNSILDTLFL